jgi:hypothetical protein
MPGGLPPAFAGDQGQINPGSASNPPGRTHFAVDGVDLDALREVRAVAAARIAEMRGELAVLEAELEVLDQALEEAAPEPGVSGVSGGSYARGRETRDGET